jgi:outer membrane murein-binding lipoprotein Lpp
MAEKLYKVNEAIELGYQAPNKETGLVGVVAEIYLPNKQKNTFHPDVALVEVEATGTYRGEFTPDEQGTWQIIMHKADGDSQVTKSYSVGAHNVHTVGEAVGTVDGKIVTVDGKVDTVDGKVVAATGKIDTVDSKVVTLDGKVVTVDGKVDGVDSKVTTVDGKVVTVTGKVDTLQTKCNTIETKIDAITTSVGSLDTPPMAF